MNSGITKMAGTVVPAPTVEERAYARDQEERPPISPNQAMRRGTRPELYIR